jgi:hypothetical protein
LRGVAVSKSSRNVQRGQAAPIRKQRARSPTIGKRRVSRAPHHKKAALFFVPWSVNRVQHPDEPIDTLAVVPNVPHRRVFGGKLRAIATRPSRFAKLSRGKREEAFFHQNFPHLMI